MKKQGSPFRSVNPHRLYRNPSRGVIAGVCAGVGDYFGIAPWAVRLLLIVAIMFTMVTLPIALVAYIVAAVVIPARPPEPQYESKEDEEFWRSMATKPDVTLSGVRHRFRDIEKRIGEIEGYVASKEYELDRAFRDLEDRPGKS